MRMGGHGQHHCNIPTSARPARRCRIFEKNWGDYEHKTPAWVTGDSFLKPGDHRDLRCQCGYSGQCVFSHQRSLDHSRWWRDDGVMDALDALTITKTRYVHIKYQAFLVPRLDVYLFPSLKKTQVRCSINQVTFLGTWSKTLEIINSIDVPADAWMKFSIVDCFFCDQKKIHQIFGHFVLQLVPFLEYMRVGSWNISSGLGWFWRLKVSGCGPNPGILSQTRSASETNKFFTYFLLF